MSCTPFSTHGRPRRVSALGAERLGQPALRDVARAVAVEDEAHEVGLRGHDLEPVRLDDAAELVARGAVAEGVGAVVAAALVRWRGCR